MCVLNEEEFKYKVAKNIKLYRKDTQEITAEKAEISTDTLSAAERGKAVMNIFNFVKLCNVMNVTPNDILKEFINNKDRIVEQELLDEISKLTLQEKEFLKTVIKFIKTHDKK